jgi:hypothetical protein
MIQLPNGTWINPSRVQKISIYANSLEKDYRVQIIMDGTAVTFSAGGTEDTAVRAREEIAGKVRDMLYPNKDTE